MIGRLFVGVIILVCCGCSTAAMNTEVASTKWRMENLEQRFLDFREKAALREAGLSTRITKLEKELGLPVPSQEEMILASTQLTPDVHVFVARNSGKAAQQQAAAKTVVKPPRKAAPAKTDGEKAYSVASTKSEDEEAAIAMFLSDIPKEPTEEQSKPKKAPTAKATHKASAKASTKPAVKSSQKAAKASAKPVIVSSPTVQRKSTQKPSKPRIVSKATAKPKPVQAKSVARSPKRTAKKTGANSMYKHGLQLLNNGRYIEGRERLEEFLTEFPQSPLVPNAVYWVGESFYSQKDFRIAVDLFREVLRRFPQSNKAKAAMLKIGYSYERLDEFSEARRYLLKVVEKYPKSNEARLARKMLSGI